MLPRMVRDGPKPVQKAEGVFMNDLIKLVDLFQREFDLSYKLKEPGELRIVVDIALMDTVDGDMIQGWSFIYNFKDDNARRRFGMLCHAIYTKSHPWEWTITTFVSRQ